MMEQTNQAALLGEVVKKADLSLQEQKLVEAAWDASTRGWDHFPVGSALWAVNPRDEGKLFQGCNVANDAFSVIVCAEQNAVTTAVQEGYRSITQAAVICSEAPGVFPCGICRQALCQYADHNATFLVILDCDSTVRRVKLWNLLPSPSKRTKQQYDSLSAEDQMLVDEVIGLLADAYVPYSRRRRAAIAFGARGGNELVKFSGVQLDNASYPASISAECCAISAAVSAGYTRVDKLIVAAASAAKLELQDSVIDGGSLQFLREFGGKGAEVLLVGVGRSVTFAKLDELLPGSFGPDSLGDLAALADRKLQH
jgi:cytidine deaminase